MAIVTITTINNGDTADATTVMTNFNNLNDKFNENIINSDIDTAAAIDLSKLAQPAWTSFTPTWTAVTTNPALGNGTFRVNYQRVGRIITVRFDLTMGSTTTFGSGIWEFTYPVAPVSNYRATTHFGTFHIEDAGTRGFMAAPYFQSTSVWRIEWLDTGATNNWGNVTDASPHAWADTDYIRGTFSYEASS